MMPRVMVFVRCTSPQWNLSAYEISSHFKIISFMLMPCIVSKLCSGHVLSVLYFHWQHDAPKSMDSRAAVFLKHREK